MTDNSQTDAWFRDYLDGVFDQGRIARRRYGALLPVDGMKVIDLGGPEELWRAFTHWRVGDPPIDIAGKSFLVTRHGTVVIAPEEVLRRLAEPPRPPGYRGLRRRPNWWKRLQRRFEGRHVLAAQWLS